jgi:hypothetical protein
MGVSIIAPSAKLNIRIGARDFEGFSTNAWMYLDPRPSAFGRV